MSRNRYDYSQLGIGDCGHVVHTWPQVYELGGRGLTVICEDCTRIANELPDSEGLHVWVPLKVEKKEAAASPEPKPKKPKKLSPFNALLQQEGLL